MPNRQKVSSCKVEKPINFIHSLKNDTHTHKFIFASNKMGSDLNYRSYLGWSKWCWNLPTYLISPGNELSSNSHISKTEKNLEVRLSYLVDSSSFQSQIVSTIPNVNIIVKQVKNRVISCVNSLRYDGYFTKPSKNFQAAKSV